MVRRTENKSHRKSRLFAVETESFVLILHCSGFESLSLLHFRKHWVFLVSWFSEWLWAPSPLDLFSIAPMVWTARFVGGCLVLDEWCGATFTAPHWLPGFEEVERDGLVWEPPPHSLWLVLYTRLAAVRPLLRHRDVFFRLKTPDHGNAPPAFSVCFLIH